MSDHKQPASSELSKVYSYFVIYECIMVNIVGFFTLFFQCELQDLAANYHESHPDIPKDNIESIFGHDWLEDDLNCKSREAQCLSYMVTGWLFIAGVLQIFIHFDNFRRKLFPSDPDLSRGIKIICMYSFFLCDWYWVILMYSYIDVVSWHQRVGSWVAIIGRIPFAINTNLMFKNTTKTKSN